MNASHVSIPSYDGQSFSAYLSLPPKGTGPGLILIQEIWGVNEHIRAVADQYAMDGYVVLAPDIFWRQKPGVDLQYTEADTKFAYQYMTNLDAPNTVRDLQSAAQALRERPEVTGKIASLGFCMGGRLSYALAATGAVDGAVCYYGGGIQNNLEQAPAIQAPILFHYAELDDHIPPTAVAAVQAAFAGRSNAQFHVYPGVGHGFNCWSRPLYNQRAAALARGRTLQWLAENLG
ncbi:carboxymethylenebutenolidase [Rhodoferax lacus]|uniref:Carboxymethylenebutenolidase n=1 Tax=Rhodoferax lacus TaxID=2184758 RepID=A0A3E1RBE7_9BURK|nr:dienelactone hydrolase family protein [Rhodoferax lacus]RFO96677.1 carboxymethylenebutenolidase [Rhodoferax lacus]